MDEWTFETVRARCSKDVIRFYDRYAATWDLRFGDGLSTRRFHEERLGSFLALARLKPSDQLIELGCGTGPYLGVIAPQVERVICVDGSQAMLAMLEAKHGHLRNVLSFCRDLEEPGGISFVGDVVYCFGLLEHVVDTAAFMDNCRRMVRPGGRLIFVGPNGRSPWYGRLRGTWRAGAHCSTDRYYRLEKMNALVEPFGFRLGAFLYWGWVAAGMGDGVYYGLAALGRVLGRVVPWMAGGLTVSYFG